MVKAVLVLSVEAIVDGCVSKITHCDNVLIEGLKVYWADYKLKDRQEGNKKKLFYQKLSFFGKTFLFLSLQV